MTTQTTAEFPGRVYVDSFESSLRKKDHGNRDAVLAEVKRGGKFSTFEATNILMRTLNGLVEDGGIEEVPSGYPWHCYKIKDVCDAR